MPTKRGTGKPRGRPRKNQIIPSTDQQRLTTTLIDEEINDDGNTVKRVRLDITEESHPEPSVGLVELPPSISNYFKVTGFDPKNKETVILECKLCAEKRKNDENPKQSTVKMIGKNTFGPLRHLREVHKIDTSQRKRSDKVITSNQLAITDFTNNSITHSRAYMKTFIEDILLDMICIDGLPFSICDMVGFKLALKTLARGTTLMTRQGVKKLLCRRVETNVKTKLKEKLIKSSKGSLAIMLDFWSSRQLQTVLGVTVQFINESWEMERLVVAFKYCQGAMTGNVVENLMLDILNEYSISKEQLSCIMADSGSNMNKAFNTKLSLVKKNAGNTTTINDSTSINLSDDDEANTSDDDNDDSSNDSDLESTSSEDGLTDSNDADEWEDIEEEIEDDSQISVIDSIETSWNRKKCLCHVINLIVKHGLKNTPSIHDLLSQAKKLITFFRKSNKNNDKLKSKTKGLGLRAPIETRWNSMLFALERLCRGDVFIHMAPIVDDHNITAQGKKNPIKPLTAQEKQKLIKITELLKPLQVATDAFQKSDVTSCNVIWQLGKMIDHISGYDCGELVILKENILEQCRQRLPEFGKDSSYILAAALDPRQKLACFSQDFRTKHCTYLPVPTKENVKKMLEEEIRGIEMELVGPTPQHLINQGHSQPTSSSTTSSTDDIYSYIQSSIPSLFDDTEDTISYFAESIQKCDPLEYWKKSALRFPKLAIIAKRVFGVPASSSDVERLFSVAGALQRSRRSLLKCDTIENILMYRDHRITELKKQGKICEKFVIKSVKAKTRQKVWKVL